MCYSRDCCCSVAKLDPTLCNPMECTTPGFPVLHYLQKFAQTHVHWVSDAIQTVSVALFLSCPQFFQTLGSFPISQLFESGDQSIGASISASWVSNLLINWFEGIHLIFMFHSTWNFSLPLNILISLPGTFFFLIPEQHPNLCGRLIGFSREL